MVNLTGTSSPTRVFRMRLPSEARIWHKCAVAGAPVDLIQRVPLFSDLGRKEVEQVASSMKERNFAAGETLTVKGRGRGGVFLLEGGVARGRLPDEERAKARPRSHFGASAPITPGA